MLETNKMSMANDSMAVVHSEAKIHGLSNLRMVDKSAMPFLPPVQAQATVFVFGEKFAVEILHKRNVGGGTDSYSKLGRRRSMHVPG